MNLFLLNIILALFWAAVTVSFTPVNLLIGFALGAIALWFMRERFQSKYFDRGGLVLRLVGSFIWQLIISSLQVAYFVVVPWARYTPGIVAIPLDIKNDIEITVLANLISLTPGTLSIDVSTDKSTLYVHAMDVSDPDALRRQIKDGFETLVREAFE
jgi:multicomponent Na+:H+ antiporter subunit E